MVRYQNLTRKPELFRAPLGPGPGTMYPPLAGPAHGYEMGCLQKGTTYTPEGAPPSHLFSPVCRNCCQLFVT